VVTVHGPLNSDLRRFYRALAPRFPWRRSRAWPFANEKQDYALFLGRFHPDKDVHLAGKAAHEANTPLI